MIAFLFQRRDMQSNRSGTAFIFPTVVALTIISGATSFILASEPNPTDQQRRIIESTSNTWLMGTGTIFGLLGGCSSSTSKLGEREERNRD